jgi:inositol transport system substrate-binding protein
MSTKTLLTIALGAFMALPALAQKPIEVGYVNLADTDVFCMSRKTSLIAAAQGSSFHLNFADANNDIQKQLDAADTFIAKKVDMLVLVPVDSTGIVPAITKANAAGIPVICLGIKADSGNYTFVGSQNYDAGFMQGALFAKLLPKNGKVLYLAGTAGLSHSFDRRKGFKEALVKAGRGDVQILADMDGDYTRAKGLSITEDWLQTFPKFDAVVAANDQMALGAVEALKGAKRLAGVSVTGIDGTKDACLAVKNGEMVQTVLQNAPGQAKACLEAMQKLAAKQAVQKEILVPFESITKDNVDKYMK